MAGSSAGVPGLRAPQPEQRPRDPFALPRLHLGSGHRRVLPLESPADLARIVRGEVQPGDLVVCLGAGDITSWAYALPGQLEQLDATAR